MRFSISQLMAPFESKLLSHSSFGSDLQRKQSEGQPYHVGISLGQVRGTIGQQVDTVSLRAEEDPRDFTPWQADTWPHLNNRTTENGYVPLILSLQFPWSVELQDMPLLCSYRWEKIILLCTYT